jgi:hypothetical protein
LLPIAEIDGAEYPWRFLVFNKVTLPQPDAGYAPTGAPRPHNTARVPTPEMLLSDHVISNPI